VVAGVAAAWFSLWFGWWMYRHTSLAEKPEAGALTRSLMLYFCVAETLLIILLAVWWVLVLLEIF